MKTEKPEKRKNPILQSYILSLLSLVLCCAMFMSATMAWFTSEVTTTQNQIYVGSLDVDLQGKDGKSLHSQVNALFNQVLLPVTGQTDGSGVAAVSEENAEPVEVTHWQDGAVALEVLQVVNEGDLAFDYKLDLVLSNEGDEQKDLSAVTDQFEVWVLAGEADYEDFAAALEGKAEKTAVQTAAETGEESDEPVWTRVGAIVTDAQTNTEVTDYTLTAILESGTPVFSGTMTAEEIAAAKGNGEAAAHVYTVVLRMTPGTSATVVEVDDDGNATTESIMGKTLFLNARLVASQQIDEPEEEQTVESAAETADETSTETQATP